MNLTKNQTALLRPFDLEAAKAGDLLCDKSGKTGWKYVAGPDCDGVVAAIFCKTGRFIEPVLPEEFRMAPLTWVEGKPVYKGDILYRPELNNHPHVAMCLSDDGEHLRFEGSRGAEYVDNRRGYLTWTPPVVKKRVKLSAFIDERGYLRWVREELFSNRGQRVPSEDKIVEVEFPVDAGQGE